VLTRCTIAARLVNSANVREHFMVRAKRTKAHRFAAWAGLKATGSPGSGPATITLTRVGGRTMDSDGLAIAFKAVRDGVADWLGVDDGHESLTWRYAAQKATKALPPHTVIIEVEWK